MKERDKCQYCGAYMHDKPLYSLHRKQGQLDIKICPKCLAKNNIWRRN